MKEKQTSEASKPSGVSGGAGKADNVTAGSLRKYRVLELESETVPYCNFCGRTAHGVEHMISSPRTISTVPVYICDICVDVCYSLLDERREQEELEERERESFYSCFGLTPVEGAEND